jgi:hypothetical protein
MENTGMIDVVLAGELFDIDPEEMFRESAKDEIAEAIESPEAEEANEEIAEDEELEGYDYDEPWEDPMMADAEALASAGWGTDEDYGCYGGDEW